MKGWSPDDVKRMVGFMHDLNRDLKAGPGGKPLNMLIEVRAVGEAPKTD